MHESYLLGLAAILVIGMLATWVAWRLHLPSILLLLISGLFVGPLTGFLDPDKLFGPVLVPLVSISVGIILFEGGLSLNFAGLSQVGGVVRNLVTIGILITWSLATLAAWLLLGMEFRMALLIGAVLVVTGPTVIIPLLNHVRPKGHISTVIRWEGILNDPVGALLALLVFEAIIAEGATNQVQEAALQFLYSTLTGVGIGFLAAVILIVLLKYYLLPDYLQNPFSLTTVIAAFTASNHFWPESGLLATTVMGMVLANQKQITVRHIVEFKENLRVLVISSLFILLAARLKITDIEQLGWSSLLFLVVLILVVRPIAVILSAMGSDLKPAERRFLSWMAPRGIVAAAVSSIFAERLLAEGYPGAELLVPVTFLIIIGTVTIYGLSAFSVAKRLKLAEPSPQGVLFVGAHSWARAMAESLKKEGFQVVLADSNWANVSKSRLAGLPTHFGGILSRQVLDGIELYGVGRIMALTSNDEANSLAALHFADVFGRKEVYQLPPEGGREGRKLVSPIHLSGRFLFGYRMNYDYLAQRFRDGARLKKSNLTGHFGIEDFIARYGESSIPLFIVTKEKQLRIVTAAQTYRASAGDTLIALIEPVRETESSEVRALPPEYAPEQASPKKKQSDLPG